ncbi:unnamed protein product [Urochloa humidicola]
MDKTTTATTQQARKAQGITASKGPKRLAFQFQIGKRGPFGGARRGTILLITNRFGVWSLRRWRRYDKKTRFHRFHHLKKKAAAAVEKLHAALRRLGMRSWPEYHERVALLREKLAGGRVLGRGAGAVQGPGHRLPPRGGAAQARAAPLLLRLRSHARRARPLCSVVVGGGAREDHGLVHCVIAFCVCLFYKTVVDLWRFTFHEPDVIVRMLERVS